MTNKFAIDTGDERHIVGHFVSGTIASGVLASTLNYNKYKNDEMSKSEMLNNTAKLAVQGGVGTAAAISAANNMGKGNWLGVVASIAAGVGGVYATQIFYDKLELNYSEKEAIEEKPQEAK